MSEIVGGIAIIGMAGRFPKARSIREFWQNTINGVDCTSELTVDEIIASGVDPSAANSANYVRRGALLEDSDHFDAPFFDLLPNEARLTDPQIRIFLECVQEALDDAGCDPDRYEGSIGVYAGAGLNNYLLKNILSKPGLFEDVLDFQTIISNDKDFLSTQASYKFNLTGPSISIQTACSTSLVAIQLAYQALLTYQCDIALAGGVHLRFPRAKGTPYREGEIYAPDGVCRPFDQAASGTIFGEGAGLVALKRYDEAVRDRDHIYGVILASALNNDGADKVSYAAPSVKGQAQVITTALTLGGVSADEIGYVEAHGTGTKLGDPIEIRSLSQAYRQTTDMTQYCAIGSGKAMIGHLDVAAGVTGLMRATLALHNRFIPPTLNFDSPNPELGLESSPFYVEAAGAPWKDTGKPRIAAVSSFGVGGTNAHAIVQEAEVIESGPSERKFHLLPISAKTKEALDAQTAELAKYLRTNPGVCLADAGYTLQQGRRQFQQRVVHVCSTVEESIESLSRPTSANTVTGQVSSGERPVCFAFSGQGSQFVNMCRNLYESERVFTEVLDKCAAAVEDIVGGDLLKVIFADSEGEEATDLLRQTCHAQPAIYAIECGLSALWQQFGVMPEAMIGHSIGEFAAAHVAGVFSLEDGARIVAKRGALMQQMAPGAMLSIRGQSEHLEPVMHGRNLAIVVVNGPELTVVGGTIDDIQAFQHELEDLGIQSTILMTSHAFHSFMMDDAVGPFIDEIKKYDLNAPSIPFISNVTGTWITAEQATDAAYWGEHLRSPVKYSEGISTLCRDHRAVLLEVGPGQVLTSLQREQDGSASQTPIIPSVRHAKQSVDDVAYFYRALGGLWTQGAKADLSIFYADEVRNKVPLPGYQFQRERYWIDQIQRDSQTKNTEVDGQAETGAAKAESADVSFGSGTDDLLAVILETARKILGCDTIRAQDNFFDLGGHSLVAAQFLSTLKDETGKQIPMETLNKAKDFSAFCSGVMAQDL